MLGTQNHGKMLADEILAAHMTKCALGTPNPHSPREGHAARDTADDTFAEIDELESLSSGSDIDTQDELDTSSRNALRLLDMIVARHVTG